MEPKDVIKVLLVHITQDIDCDICPYQNVSPKEHGIPI